ncbi:MAG: LamG-like jellyroll fold domain-containing protein [Planctomycetota bacterium]|jgi:hypothetical protein
MYRVLILPILVLFASSGCWGSPTAGAAEPSDATILNTDQHLAGWWKFDEPSGSTAKDSSKHGRDAALAGGLSFDQNSVPGRIGKALNFDGRSNLVEVTGYKGVAGTGPRTICVWIKTGTSRGDIVSWGAQDFGQMWILRFIRGHVGVTPHGGYYYMEDNVHDQAWHHVAVVVREAGLPNLHDDVTLYLDGKIAKPDRIGLLDLWPIETGAERHVAIAKGFKGDVDDLRIYDRALSDEEVKALYDLGG